MVHWSAPFARCALGRRWSAARTHSLLLALVLGVAAATRLSGVAWDGGLWLHPDERQIYFVANGLGSPESWPQAFDASSPLNPHFFAYGSLPIYLVRLAAILLAALWPVLRDPGNLHLVGRPLAALLDVATVGLTCRLVMGMEAWHGGFGRGGGQPALPGVRPAAGLLAAALLSLAVLPIQAGHFYTADGLLTFLVMLSLNFASDFIRGAGRGRLVALGVGVGLAMATKISAAPLLFVMAAACWLRSPSAPPAPRWRAVKGFALVAAVAVCTFLLVEPYAAIDFPTFVADSLRESGIAWGRLDAPYTRQYAGMPRYLYPIWQTALWGMGLPLGMLGWGGLAAGLIRWLRRGEWVDALLLAWAGPYLAVTGALYAQPLRYMLPLVPVLCILGARLVARAVRRTSGAARRWLAAGTGLLLLSSLAYAWAFLSIYRSPHSWIVASEWIYRHVPAGSSLAVEEWDTPLPLPIDVRGEARRSEEFNLHTLTLYDEPDGAEKWLTLTQQLAASDYLVVASRRLYGSLYRLPDRYPLASRYYSLLFEGELGFEPVGEFARGAAWLNPRVEPLPGAAPFLFVPDESMVVYDHPRVLLFRNAVRLSPGELFTRLSSPAEVPD